MKSRIQQAPVNHKTKVREVRYQCTDEIGQRATFTVDENGKQNSPSFASFYNLMEWALIPSNYSFLAEMRASNNKKQASDYPCIYCTEYAVKFNGEGFPVCDNHDF